MPIPIGIDLGTTFSLIACYRHERVEIISDSYDRGLIPSMVYFDPETGEASVGRMAYEQSPQFPSNFIKDAKRLIGREFEDDLVKKWLQPLQPSFQVTKTENEMAAYEVKIKGKPVLKKPEDVSAEVLKYLVNFASEYLGERVEEAVISVPAYFSGAQRKATLKAAELADLRVRRLISEPVAGALHYVADKQVEGKILIFDFGGGTLDVSLIEVIDHVFEVNAVSGDTLLGGKNIDDKLSQHFYRPARNCLNKERILRGLRRLEKDCTTVKENLSNTNFCMKIIDGYDGDTDLTLKMDRDKFNDLNRDIFEKTLDVVNECLRSVKWTKDEINTVVLIGGSTRIPKIREMLQDYFGTSKIKTDLNPDEAVARGACLHAAIFNKVSGCIEKYGIHEVNPLSLGIEAYGILNCVVIPRNSKLPASGNKTLATTLNNQNRAIFTITEGERKNSKLNNELGHFTIDGLPAKRAGDVSFTVNFTLDEDGILTVNATENSTGRNSGLKITMEEFRLSQQEINYNINISEKQKEEDDLFEKFIRRRNELTEQCHRWEYDNDNADVCNKCTDFIRYAEHLSFKKIDELNDKFEKLKEQVYGLTPTLVFS